MIYIHVPFCRSFCTYCGFYSEVAGRCGKNDALFEDFGQALKKEILSRKDEITDQVNTLYIGGGTPSVLPLSVFRDVLSVLEEVGHGGPYEEFTVEVNPEDIVEKGPDYVRGLVALGVNRVSMGVQSFDDGILRWMNRRHDAATARRAYAILEDAGVENISIDFIFGLPQLSEQDWEETLTQALSISQTGGKPFHISAYQLSIEPESALASVMEKGGFEEASDELCRWQYERLCARLAEAGYNHYEISNFALPGYEAKHNSAYWKHIPYVGLGPAAHSFIISPETGEQLRRWNEPSLTDYLDAARSGDFSAAVGSEILTTEQIGLERIMLGLRTSEGLPVSDIVSILGSDSNLEHCLAQGLLEILPKGNVRIPERHFFISDSIISDLV